MRLFQLDATKNLLLSYFIVPMANITGSQEQIVLEDPFPLQYLIPKNSSDFFRFASLSQIAK